MRFIRPKALLRVSAIALGLYVSVSQAQVKDISFPLTDFTTWTLFGSATAETFTPGNGFTYSNLALTTSGTVDSAGAGFSPDPLFLNFNQSFSFLFNFFIPVPSSDSTTRGDGFTFTLATSPGLGGGGSDLGYGGLGGGDSIAFAIDTFNFDDEPASPSLQILQNGSTSPLAVTETGLGDAIRDPDFQWFASFSFTPSGLEDETGTVLGTISHLNLGDFSVSAEVDLSLLGGAPLDGGHLVYFGFTAGNGAAIDGHIMTSAEPAPVPLPAAGWLMLTALGFLRVKRRNEAPRHFSRRLP
jgi:hypothetical protein